MTVRHAMALLKFLQLPALPGGRPLKSLHVRRATTHPNAAAVLTATRLHIVAQGWTRSGLPWVTIPTDFPYAEGVTQDATNDLQRIARKLSVPIES
jgi:hypothetical protein